MSITVLIPAHNEQENIAATIHALREQTHEVGNIVVSLDNCTDQTGQVASEMGCTTLTTVDNNYMRAGAINQAVLSVIDELDDEDFLFVLDADTVVDSRFVEHAVSLIGDADALGSSFRGSGGTSIVETLQQNEYLRIARTVSRRNAEPFVLSGACEFLPVRTARRVISARASGVIKPGVLYNYESVTEDWELTVAMRHLNMRLVSPKECLAWTEVMDSHDGLLRQRDRWQKGYLEVLRMYGWGRHTARSFLHQVGIYVGSLVPVLWAAMVIWSVLLGWQWTFTPVLFGMFLVVWFERAWSVRAGGLRNVLVASAFLPELLYEFWKNFVFWRAGIKFIRRTADVW